jgi:hypothetical protein
MIRQVPALRCDVHPMEAATPLRPPHVRLIGDRVAVDGLVIDDESAVRLVREREETGADPVRVIEDAIAIGARVLDREQAGANVEWVKSELTRMAGDTEAVLRERSAELADDFAKKFDEAFGEGDGHLAKSLERLFSDESSAAVQNRIKEMVGDVMARSREDLARQFSADDDRNPLAGFQKASLEVIRQAASQQDNNLRAMHAQMADLRKELQGLRDDKQKQLELAEAEEKGTAKGRTFEERVYEALDVIAVAQGDDCDAVGDLKGSTGRSGDIVVDIDACAGPSRGRIVWEAKNSKLSRPEALRQLDQALAVRDADYAVLVVPSEDKLPARTLPLREHNGDKMIVTYDPDEDSAVSLQVAYSLARARVLMARGEAEGVDTAAIADTVERALDELGNMRSVKSQLTGAETSIGNARSILEAMAAAVKARLEEIDRLVAAGEPPPGD